MHHFIDKYKMVSNAVLQGLNPAHTQSERHKKSSEQQESLEALQSVRAADSVFESGSRSINLPSLHAAPSNEAV